MKPFFILKLILLGLITLFSSCRGQDPVKYLVQLDSACDEESQLITQNVIIERLSKYTRIELKQPLENNNFIINVYLNENGLIPEELFTQKGKLYIAETYNSNELVETLININTILRGDALIQSYKEKNIEQIPPTRTDSLFDAYFNEENHFAEEFELDNPLFALLMLNSVGGQLVDGPSLGIASVKDTAIINAIFNRNDIRSLFPENIQLNWMINANYYDDNQAFFDLIAVKIPQVIDLNKETVEKLYLARSSYTGNSEILMNFKKEKVSQWYEITSKNIGRRLSVLLDDKVLINPIVNSPIEGGAMMISGDFMETELLSIESIFHGGIIDCNVIKVDLID